MEKKKDLRITMAENQKKAKRKQCSKCKQNYPATHEFFYRKQKNLSGFDSWCKGCKKLYDMEHHKLKNFNITNKKFNIFLENQNYRCGICGRLFEDLFKKYNDKTTVRTPRIDHDHKTGKIRGILCNRCNMLLGRAVDNRFILIKAINYLNKNKKKRIRKDTIVL